MRSSAWLRAADDRGADPGFVRVPAGNGATGSAVRAADSTTSTANRECRCHSMRLPGGFGAARTIVRAANCVQSASETESPRGLRMSEGYGGERKHMYRAGAPVTGYHTRRYHQEHPSRR